MIVIVNRDDAPPAIDVAAIELMAGRLSLLTVGSTAPPDVTRA